MARVEIKDIDRLTAPEIMVLEFLQDNKGAEFSPHEIGRRLQIETRFVVKIIESLIWKGCPVAFEKHREKAYIISNTWLSYALGSAVFGGMFVIILWAFVG